MEILDQIWEDEKLCVRQNRESTEWVVELWLAVSHTAQLWTSTSGGTIFKSRIFTSWGQ